MDDLARYLEPGTDSDELIVLLHGLGNASERLAAVREVIRAARPHAAMFAPELPFGQHAFCLEKAEDIVARLLAAIDSLVMHGPHGKRYTSITLIGHSFGAVLARKIAVVAFGEQTSPEGDTPAPFEPEFSAYRAPRVWAPSIRRIVLLAGMNRGWSVASAMDWWTGVQWMAVELIGETLLAGKPTVFALRRGAPFLVQTRLQWLAMMDPDYGPRPDIIAVQLLGTADDLVAPDDHVDYAVDLFGGRERQAYFYLEVKASDHRNVVDVSATGSLQTMSARAQRRQQLLIALHASRADLALQCIPRDEMADVLPAMPDPSVTDVVFVVHGIRDKGYWTQKIARTIKHHAAAGQKFESWTESYGYFAMLPFVFRAARQRKVEWLMDRYVDMRARFPRARMHYVGHSNGTYLAAQALQDYRAARFTRIVFAGSVVRRDYDWMSLMTPAPGALPGAPRVAQVLNYVATRDWVVALFPKGMQPWRRFNLGSAGHDGFIQGSECGPVHQIRYLAGDHRTGHEESNWNDIARFIVSGAVPTMRFPPFSKTQSRLWRWMGAASFVLFPLLVAIIVSLGIVLLWSMFASLPCEFSLAWRQLAWHCAAPRASEAAWYAIGFFGYLWGLRLLVTRF